MSQGNISLSHGGGGVETQQLIQTLFYRYFDNDLLKQAEDAAVFETSGALAFTTDSFTVTPLFFKGGDIGKLAVAGTVNDLAMMAAQPLYLSCAFMIEEGLPWKTLERLVQSMAQELKKTGAKVVCGDTKVVPKGAVDQVFINTSGIGQLALPTQTAPTAHGLQAGDVIIVSQDIGRHGAVILAERETLQLQTPIESDCTSVWPAVEALLDAGVPLHALRDATRGGLAAVLNEWAQASAVSIDVQEAQVPISESVQGICELLGFEAYDFANEGTFVLSVPASAASDALAILHQFDFCENAAVIGEVLEFQPGLVILSSAWGAQRVLELPQGELLPRIC